MQHIVGLAFLSYCICYSNSIDVYVVRCCIIACKVLAATLSPSLCGGGHGKESTILFLLLNWARHPWILACEYHYITLPVSVGKRVVMESIVLTLTIHDLRSSKGRRVSYCCIHVGCCFCCCMCKIESLNYLNVVSFTKLNDWHITAKSKLSNELQCRAIYFWNDVQYIDSLCTVWPVWGSLRLTQLCWVQKLMSHS